MTLNVYILPMSFARRCLYLVYEGFELLDISGPVSMFNTANRYVASRGYEAVYLSLKGGMVEASCGLSVETRPVAGMRLILSDTLLVVGADETSLRAAMSNEPLLAFIARAGCQTGRVASICSGAFLLAAAGVLAGKSVTTHWSGRDRLESMFPDVRVEQDALYLKDGNIWTSAGAAAGIDLALAMLRHDHGDEVMRRVARRLVVYAHRPGQQSQFSTVLDRQAAAPAFSGLIAWLDARLSEPLGVADMARQCVMSERSFYRKFTEDMGTTPARFLEELRLHNAKLMLESGTLVKAVAGAVGFRSESAFRTAFSKFFGITPSVYRTLHSA